jgi:Tol biopolymer transport system component
MNGHDHFDRTLAGWFESDAQASAPGGEIDRVLDAARRRRPRPAWLAGPGSHWIGEAHGAGASFGAGSLTRSGLRWSTAVVVFLVLLALIGGAILVGARLIHPSPLPHARLGHLAYGLDADIYVADWDGRNPVRIADGAFDPGGGGPASCGSFWGEGPMWAPDGQHLAYRVASDAPPCPSVRDGVHLSDPAGHVVASFLGTGWRISWSPDSTRVATWAGDIYVSAGGSRAVGIYGIDGRRQALLTVPDGCSLPGDFDPVWSPDGKSVVIWPCEVPVDGRTPQPLPGDDPRSHADWAYSPDGARVAYISAESLVVAAADGSEARVLIPRVVTSAPVWSPTGDRIAFTWSADDSGYDQAGNAKPRTYELRVVDVASGTLTSLVSTGGIGFIKVIRFSPEGDRILFSTLDANGSGTSLSSVRADSPGIQRLVTGTGWGDWQSLLPGP